MISFSSKHTMPLFYSVDCSDRESDQRTHEPRFSCLATGIACLHGRSAPTKEHNWQGARGSMCLQHAESAFDGYNRGRGVLV